MNQNVILPIKDLSCPKNDNKYYVNQNRKVQEKTIFGNNYEMGLVEYNLIYYMKLELTT